MTTPDPLPRGVTTLVNKAADPWTHRIQSVTGSEVEFTALLEGKDGHRHRQTRTEVVDSIGVRFSHPSGRAAVALWWRREGKASYAFTGAVRGHGARTVERGLKNATVTQVTAI